MQTTVADTLAYSVMTVKGECVGLLAYFSDARPLANYWADKLGVTCHVHDRADAGKVVYTATTLGKFVKQ